MRGLEKPILFNTEMVKAIVDGKKIVTRRVIKNKYPNADIELFENKYGKRLVYKQNDVPEPVINEDGSRRVHLTVYEEIKKPYEIGDILYVRETWAVCSALNLCSPNKCAIEHQMKENIVWYRANGEQPNQGKTSGEHLIGRGKWRPSIHMPRAAARIFLKVIGIRAEKLHALDYDSVLREGLRTGYDGWTLAFKNLWDSTLRKDQLSMYGWDSNPWVWVIEFEKCQ